VNNDEILEVTDDTFDYEVLGADKPSLIYFTVSWSRSCRDHLEILEDLVDDYVDKVRFFQLDVERNPRIKSRFRIMVTPTVVILRNGEEAMRFTTDVDPVELANCLDELLQDIKYAKKKAKEIVGKIKKAKKPKRKTFRQTQGKGEKC